MFTILLVTFKNLFDFCDIKIVLSMHLFLKNMY